MEIRSIALFLLLIIVSMLAMGRPLDGGGQNPSYEFRYPVSLPLYPVVLAAHEIPALIGQRIGSINIYAFRGGKWISIPFQLDRRDHNGLYQIPASQRDQKNESDSIVDGNDELALMTCDLGEKSPPGLLDSAVIAEVMLTDPRDGTRKWFYVRNELISQYPSMLRDYVSYDRDRDIIETDNYKIGFSRTLPFLMNHFQRKEPQQRDWSPNIMDTMKIRHFGKFLHKYDFERTQDDYKSRLVAAKDGPIRVIRRTSNRVRMFWFIKTPAIEIDFVAYRHNLYVDTLIDLPFSIGTFFSDLHTRISLDWRDDLPELQAKIYSDNQREGLVIDGNMTSGEKEFNNYSDRYIHMASTYGDLLLSIAVPDSLPIRYRNYYSDDNSQVDTPENVSGHYGDIGFMTDNWEAVDRNLHHLLFSAYLTTVAKRSQAIETARNAPDLDRDKNK
ncbi:MAG: hypothetical protein OEY67_04075 [Gammaproteobacteria bacterium]|nr:hypothetical protein [Gammaproteobacteria bacterium]